MDVDETADRIAADEILARKRTALRVAIDPIKFDAAERQADIAAVNLGRNLGCDYFRRETCFYGDKPPR